MICFLKFVIVYFCVFFSGIFQFEAFLTKYEQEKSIRKTKNTAKSRTNS